MRLQFWRGNLPTGSGRDLATVVLALADDGCDLVVAIFEYLPEEEYRAPGIPFPSERVAPEVGAMSSCVAPGPSR